ncbi:phosphotransferase [Phycisphaerales bacterium AB-hyl4]|uniref:Phosphotransferase n=1 Tax=Natronomicrosphaera hydrolytica TaxID=3242702 RepID=A0ABV4U3Y6_9BACT
MPEDPSKASKSASSSIGSDVVAISGNAGASGADVSSAASTASASSRPGGSGRAKFGTSELAIVLSHYDIGVVEAIQEFPRGSRKAPKLLVKAETGRYLLKRRARGKNDAEKVAFCHALQIHLADRQFPLPHLIGTRRDNNSMLQWQNHIYELFEYIRGAGYDASLEATGDSGKILGLFHRLLRNFKSRYQPSQGSYHATRTVNSAVQQIPRLLARGPASDKVNEIKKLLDVLLASYENAAERVNSLGLPNWPAQTVHSDWHPGNMLFRGSRVVAVIDYDSARILPRVLDVANGALQFSIIGGGDDPINWPAYIDESRYRRFLRGYDSVPDAMLSHVELKSVPWLMVEALVAEAVIHIAATGSFAHLDGLAFLKMVERKIGWIQKHANHLVQAAAD